MMTRRAPFRVFDGFIETGFEQRFQGLLRLAWQQRSWHVIVADPGSGKSMGIRDLVLTTTRERSMMSGRTCPAVFPMLHLQKWTGTIYCWLTHPLTDPQSGGRVNMDQFMKFITTALEWTYYQGEMDVSPKALEVAIDLLQNQHESIRVIDAPGAQKQVQSPPEEGQPPAPAQPAPTAQDALPQSEKEPPEQSETSSSKRGRKKKAAVPTEATVSAESLPSSGSSQDSEQTSAEVRASKPSASPKRPGRAKELVNWTNIRTQILASGPLVRIFAQKPFG